MTRIAIFNIPPSSPTSVFFSRPELFRKCVWICESFWLPLPLDICRKIYSLPKNCSSSSYNLLSCQGLYGWSWGFDCPVASAQMVQRKSGPGGQTPASLWAVMGSVAQSSPTFHHSCPEKAPSYLRLSKELDSNRGYHKESSSSGCSFCTLGECFKFWLSWKKSSDTQWQGLEG